MGQFSDSTSDQVAEYYAAQRQEQQTEGNEMTETKFADNAQLLLQGALDRSVDQTIDALLGIVVELQKESASRADDYEIGQNDALGEVIRKVHLFQLHLKEARANRA
jgi:uncharacterized protein YeeX (DUF496 family)